MKISTKRMVVMAMLAAVSILLVWLIHFPIFPAYGFLEYDMADVPILIGTFLFGPLSGLLLTFVVSAIQAFTVSAASGWVGGLMHFCATGAFVLVAGFVYKKLRSRTGATLALILGTLTMTLVMIPLNLTITVHFWGLPRDVVMGMLVPGIIPFNLIKAGANSIMTFAVYKSVGSLLRVQTLESKTQKA